MFRPLGGMPLRCLSHAESRRGFHTARDEYCQILELGRDTRSGVASVTPVGVGVREEPGPHTDTVATSKDHSRSTVNTHTTPGRLRIEPTTVNVGAHRLNAPNVQAGSIGASLLERREEFSPPFSRIPLCRRRTARRLRRSERLSDHRLRQDSAPAIAKSTVSAWLSIPAAWVRDAAVTRALVSA
jgi:hypothetical protein